MGDIKTILESLGFKLHQDGHRFWRTSAIYRDGNNQTALRISCKNGSFVDFVENTSGSFEKLIKLTLGLKSSQEATKWLSEKQYVTPEVKKEFPKIIMSEMWEPKILNKLVKEHTYWNRRGIKNEVVQQFKGGIAIEGRMKDRYVIPVFDHKERIVGFAGRDLTNKHIIKWKLIGEKLKWTFPLHLNRENIIAADEVILVESIGDLLKLWQTGFDNSICLFGTFLSDKMISVLAGLPIKKIYISTNNDVDNKNQGNRQAVDMYVRMLSFIDKSRIQIKLPLAKDFGDMDEEFILKWKDLKSIAIVGGRDFNDMGKLNDTLVDIKKETGMVVSGGALGADTLGEKWAAQNRIPFIKFLPEWQKYGKQAGFIRNEYIIRNADKVYAFWNGTCGGTANDISIAEKLNKPIEIVSY